MLITVLLEVMKWVLCIFVIYLVVMLTWGIVDIRCENYQMGGHRYPNGPLIDGHKYYFHHYYTWYFLPYRWIEKGIKEDESSFVPSKRPCVGTCCLDEYSITPEAKTGRT